MYNRVILMGRLTRDPELRTTQSGISMCRFSIAVDRSYKQGDEKQTDFFDITAWRQTAEFVSKWFSKGKLIHIEGKLQNKNYTDNNGVKHYSNIVIADNVAFCGDKSSGQQASNQTPPSQNQQYQQGYQNQQPYTRQYEAQPAPQGYQQYHAQPVQQNTVLGNLDEFEEILSDGEVPF
ncbi:MAG: single-stranded DNA-binding protein [Oscillospiraceae bacterium]|nr:single-stranded DNA-binding protein [Oscillospiraceae bacterium]